MTVINNDARDQYVATNGQTIFNYTFEISDQDNIQVYQRAGSADPDDAADLLTLTVDYTVTGVGVNTGGTIVLVSGATLNDIVTIQGAAPPVRSTSFTPGGVIQAANLNTEFDDEILIYQTILATQDFLVPKYPKSAIVNDFDLILPILDSDQTWVMNTANDEIVAADFPSEGAASKLDTFVTLTDETADAPNSFPLSGIGNGIMINRTGTTDIVTRILTGTANQIDVDDGDGQSANPTISITDNVILGGVAGMGVPQGTTAQRVIPVTGINFRYNTDAAMLEFWDGSTWTQLEDTTNFSALPTGFMTVTTGSGALNARTFVGTANQIDITNTTGAGDPAFSLSATLNFPGTFTAQGTTAISGIINDPTLATAAATNLSTSSALKTYIDSIATGLNVLGSCVAGSTVALTVVYANGSAGIGATLTNAGAQAALSLDGVSPSAGQRVLIKDQASTLQNGVYTVTDVGSGATNWVLTRATDFDAPSEIKPGDLIILTGGSTQNQSSWIETATVTTVGTDPITFVQFTASLPVNVASGGTGVTSFTTYGLIAGGTTATGPLQQVTIGASGTILRSGGAGALPTFSTATYPSTATGTGTLLRADGTNWTPTTTTYPTTNAINTIMYASSANVLAAIAAANDSVMVSGVAGVPAWSTTLPSGLSIPGYANDGVNTDITSMTGLTGKLQAPTAISSSAGLDVLAFTYTASAVNSFRMINNATGGNPLLIASGTDGTVAMDLQSKGGVFQFLDQLSTTAAEIRLHNGAASQYTGFKTANAAASTVTFIVPSADGGVSAPLITDGSATLSFLPAAWVDFSGTIGATGFTGAVTVSHAYHKRVGNTVFVNIYLSGTSNATTFTITGLPFTAARAGSFIPTSFAVDNSTNAVCNGTITGTTLTLFNSVLSTVWTNVNNKGFGGQFSYEIA